MQSQPESPESDDRPVVSTKTVEIAVTLAFVAVGLLVMWDSVRLGHRWTPDSGPQSGYFPFYISVIMLAAAATNLLRVLFASKSRDELAKPFVTWGRFKPMLAVLFPLVLFVAGIQYLGIYVSSALFIGLFMRVNGKYGLAKIAQVALVVPAVVFALFEIWFLVPLPKGPLEALFGL